MTSLAIKPAACTQDIVIDSSSLPGTLHGDPADRLLIATTRHMGATLMTRDTKILAYGAAGHVQVLPC